MICKDCQGEMKYLGPWPYLGYAAETFVCEHCSHEDGDLRKPYRSSARVFWNIPDKVDMK